MYCNLRRNSEIKEWPPVRDKPSKLEPRSTCIGETSPCRGGQEDIAPGGTGDRSWTINQGPKRVKCTSSATLVRDSRAGWNSATREPMEATDTSRGAGLEIPLQSARRRCIPSATPSCQGWSDAGSAHGLPNWTPDAPGSPILACRGMRSALYFRAPCQWALASGHGRSVAVGCRVGRRSWHCAVGVGKYRG